MLQLLSNKTPFGSRWKPPRAILFIGLAAILAVPSLGCVTVAEHRKLERRVRDMQRSQGGNESRQDLADIVSEVEELRAQVRQLNGKLEETQQTAQQGLEEARKARREAAAKSAGSPGPIDALPATGAKSGSEPSAIDQVVAEAAADGELSDELKSYQAGLAAWRDKDYPVCIDRFRGFLQTYASSSRADDAAFWIADCHFKQGEFKNAVLRFDDVVRNYPTGNRAPDALYRQGESLLKLGPGFHEAARRAFERVLKEYPNSARASEAKKQLQARAG